MQNLKVGNVGALTNGTDGLWRIDTIWQADEWLSLHSIENDEVQTEAHWDEFWVLLDSF